MTKELIKLLPWARQAASRAGLECIGVPVERFSDTAGVMKAEGYRLAGIWAVDETPFERGFCVHSAYAKDERGTGYALISAQLPVSNAQFPTLSKIYPTAQRLERAVYSLFGIVPTEHPDLRPWIKHEDWPEVFPLRKSFDIDSPIERVDGEYKWTRAEGDGVYEIPVGPVHAGIIEPGHFRFQAIGEDIINLEERLGYVHKGIEKRFESLSWQKGARLAARVSGDSTVAHACAYCMAIEDAAKIRPTDRALWIRAIMMELERVANHVFDIGAICNDAAFAIMLTQMTILRERVLRLCNTVFGHRLMMDKVIIGGVETDITKDDANRISGELMHLSGEFERVMRIYDESPSMEDRACNAGVLSTEIAKELSVVGYVARASGILLDVRAQNPYVPYDTLDVKMPEYSSGDVNARVLVRAEEVRESIRLIRALLYTMPKGALTVEWSPPAPGATGFSSVEGWRGEIIYWVQSGPSSEINRCMVRDSSAMNWPSLERAILGNIVPDFPLCNKSFNQSYSGHDL